MIEKRLSNELSIKRWRRFKAHKSAIIGIWFLILMTFFSATAELWANSRPLYFSYQGKSYFPALNDPHPSELGLEGVVIDWKQKDFSDATVIWPLIPWGPFERNSKVEILPGAPTSENWFGTDESGRDVTARLIYGFRFSMTYAVAVWFFCVLIGIVLGAMMGYFAGWFDIVAQRVIEVWESVPTLMLLIILASIISPTVWILTGFTVIFGWVGVSLYTRAEFLRLRKREFVEAARALGARTPQILFKHILPNALTPVITLTPFMVAGGVTGLAALDYLGFGLPPPTPSWGELLGQAQKHFQHAWWLAVFPSLALFFTLTALNMIGSAIRDAYDPRK